MSLLRTTAVLAFLASNLAAIPIASAQHESQYGQSDFGVGLMVGSPTGVTAKKYLAENHAFDGAFGFGYGGYSIHADYLFEQRDFLGENDARLGWFVGIGGQFQVERDRYHRGGYYGRRYDRDDRDRRNRVHAGPRAPIGLELRFRSLPPLEMFAEIALGFEIVEYPGLTLNGGLGARWYF